MKNLKGEVKSVNRKKLNDTKKRKNKKVSTLLLANIIVLLGIGIVFNIPNIYASQDLGYKEVTVVKGDTLWVLAEDIADNSNEDLKVTNIISDIKTLNDMEDSNLSVGQTIKLPIYE